MIAFEVHRNGERLCTAGVSTGVLSAIISWVGGKRHEQEAVRHGIVHQELTLHVGGLQTEGEEVGDNLKWRDEPLHTGDTILVRIIETGVVDPPESREQQDPKVREEQERAYYEHLREKYGDSQR